VSRILSAEERARRLDLLCDRELDELTSEERLELEALLSEEGGDADASDVEIALAALSIALEMNPPPLPIALRDRIEADARKMMAQKAEPAKAAPDNVVRLPEPKAAPSPWPWLVAAACFLAAIGAWVLRPPPQVVTVDKPGPTVFVSVAPPPPLTPRQARERLLAEAKDVQRIPWTATKDPGGAGASGEVLWSESLQQGFMIFRGMAANDPHATQFQLWIFDDAQDARFPVDGGVFDVSRDGESVVPITAKIHVEKPKLFAITVEKPGGVVVSKREHIVLTAAIGG
jgi:hypothetical protein